MQYKRYNSGLYVPAHLRDDYESRDGENDGTREMERSDGSGGGGGGNGTGNVGNDDVVTIDLTELPKADCENDTIDIPTNQAEVWHWRDIINDREKRASLFFAGEESRETKLDRIKNKAYMKRFPIFTDDAQNRYMLFDTGDTAYTANMRNMNVWGADAVLYRINRGYIDGGCGSNSKERIAGIDAGQNTGGIFAEWENSRSIDIGRFIDDVKNGATNQFSQSDISEGWLFDHNGMSDANVRELENALLTIISNRPQGRGRNDRGITMPDIVRATELVTKNSSDSFWKAKRSYVFVISKNSDQCNTVAKTVYNSPLFKIWQVVVIAVVTVLTAGAGTLLVAGIMQALDNVMKLASSGRITLNDMLRLAVQIGQVAMAQARQNGASEAELNRLENVLKYATAVTNIDSALRSGRTNIALGELGRIGMLTANLTIPETMRTVGETVTRSQAFLDGAVAPLMQSAGINIGDIGAFQAFNVMTTEYSRAKSWSSMNVFARQAQATARGGQATTDPLLQDMLVKSANTGKTPSIIEIDAMRNAVANIHDGKVISAIPNMMFFMRSMLATPEVVKEDLPDLTSYASFIASMTGHANSGVAGYALQLKSLLQRASIYESRGWAFVLPFGLEERIAEHYAEEIRGCLPKLKWVCTDPVVRQAVGIELCSEESRTNIGCPPNSKRNGDICEAEPDSITGMCPDGMVKQGGRCVSKVPDEILDEEKNADIASGGRVVGSIKSALRNWRLPASVKVLGNSMVYCIPKGTKRNKKGDIVDSTTGRIIHTREEYTRDMYRTDGLQCQAGATKKFKLPFMADAFLSDKNVDATTQPDIDLFLSDDLPLNTVLPEIQRTGMNYLQGSYFSNNLNDNTTTWSVERSSRVYGDKSIQSRNSGWTKTPTVGSVFIRRRRDSTVFGGGHAGIVVGVSFAGFSTVEGNGTKFNRSSSASNMASTNPSDLAIASYSYSFADIATMQFEFLNPPTNECGQQIANSATSWIGRTEADLRRAYTALGFDGHFNFYIDEQGRIPTGTENFCGLLTMLAQCSYSTPPQSCTEPRPNDNRNWEQQTPPLPQSGGQTINGYLISPQGCWKTKTQTGIDIRCTEPRPSDGQSWSPQTPPLPQSGGQVVNGYLISPLGCWKTAIKPTSEESDCTVPCVGEWEHNPSRLFEPDMYDYMDSNLCCRKKRTNTATKTCCTNPDPVNQNAGWERNTQGCTPIANRDPNYTYSTPLGCFKRRKSLPPTSTTDECCDESSIIRSMESDAVNWSEYEAMYPAVVANAGTSKETWFALIGGKYIPINTIVPEEIEDENSIVINNNGGQSLDYTERLNSIEREIVRLAELVARNTAGDPGPTCDLSAIVERMGKIDELLQTWNPIIVSNQNNYTDLSELKERTLAIVSSLDELKDMVRNIKIPDATEQTAYDDTFIREQLANLATLIKNIEVKVYDDTQVRNELARIIGLIQSLQQVDNNAVLIALQRLSEQIAGLRFTYDDTNIVALLQRILTLLAGLESRKNEAVDLTEITRIGNQTLVLLGTLQQRIDKIDTQTVIDRLQQIYSAIREIRIEGAPIDISALQERLSVIEQAINNIRIVNTTSDPSIITKLNTLQSTISELKLHCPEFSDDAIRSDIAIVMNLLKDIANRPVDVRFTDQQTSEITNNLRTVLERIIRESSVDGQRAITTTNELLRVISERLQTTNTTTDTREFVQLQALLSRVIEQLQSNVQRTTTTTTNTGTINAGTSTTTNTTTNNTTAIDNSVLLRVLALLNKRDIRRDVRSDNRVVSYDSHRNPPSYGDCPNCPQVVERIERSWY